MQLPEHPCEQPEYAPLQDPVQVAVQASILQPETLVAFATIGLVAIIAKPKIGSAPFAAFLKNSLLD